MPWIDSEPQSLDDKIAVLRGFRARFDSGEDLIYGIFDRDDATVLGAAGLHPRVGPQAAEIGYWIHIDRVQQGLASEAAAAVTRVAFELEQLQRVEIRCAPNNAASAGVARRLGYTHEVTLRRRVLEAGGALRDTMIWSLYAEDYPRSPAMQTPIQVWDAAERRVS
jgi:RimJ/RimL family protein N-acetyltransferase